MHTGLTVNFFMASTNRGSRRDNINWAGIEKHLYWIDPKRGVCGVIMMQFFPFVDAQAVGLLSDFEKAVYA